MEYKQAPPAIRQGAHNFNKDTNFPADTQIMDRILSEVRQEITKCSSELEYQKGKSYQGHSGQGILNALLQQIQPIDFREKAKIDTNVKIANKLYCVITIDEVLNTAIANNWGLCTKNSFIYVYNGSYWQVINKNDFKPFLAQAAIKMGVPILDAKYYNFKEDLYKQFLSCSNLFTPETKDYIMINLLNGTFEILGEKQVLRKPKPEDFIKHQLPFDYRPDAKCPLFDSYLTKVLPDEDCRKVLAEYIGYVFTNKLKLEKALILYGSGANGKSVFFDIINAIIGEENICSFSLQNLTKHDSYHRSELSNKLVNYTSELSGKLETSIFKQLVSGEPVEARPIYGQPFTMKDYGKLIFNCNELPKDVEQTNAFFRRFIIIPFNITIPQSDQDPELAKKIIKNELSGVFNWILQGLQRLIRQGKFTESTLINEQVNDYKKESDNVAMFIDDENYKPAINEYVALKVMYNEYKTYCYENGYRAGSIRKLSDRIKMLGFEMKRITQGNVIFAKK